MALGKLQMIVKNRESCVLRSNMALKMQRIYTMLCSRAYNMTDLA